MLAFTVRSSIPRGAAISLLEQPATSIPSTSFSRPVNGRWPAETPRPEDRYALMEEACERTHGAGFAVLDLAIRRGGVSYTADVMDALRAEYSDVELSVLLGADAARTINRWHRADDLLRTERFVIANRTGPPPLDASELHALGYDPSRTTLLTIDSPDISASDVRTRIARGESLEGLVPDVVATLIEAKGLYRNNRDNA